MSLLQSRVLLGAILLGMLASFFPRAAVAQAPPETATELHERAVDPSEYRGHDFVYLVEDGAVRIETDGTTVYRGRQVAQILTRDGARDWGELSFGYAPSRQTFTLNWLRVVGPDGIVLSEGPEHQQETSPEVEVGAPVYTDQSLIQMTVAGVAPGTLVDYSYTIETTEPRIIGDLWYHWGVNGLTPVMQTAFEVDAPSDFDLTVREKNLAFEATIDTEAGRTVRRWTTGDVPAIELESYAAFPNDIVSMVTVSGGIAWRDVGDWYAGLAADRYELTPEIERAHDEQLRDAASLEDSLRATHRWVAQDFRYVSLALGDGAYQPRLPSEVFSTGFGDCKDKATLFVALARRMGLEAHPVIVNSQGGVAEEAPSLLQFDHMIAVVEWTEGERLYFDLTSDWTRFGELPASLYGEAGLVVPHDATAELVTLPEPAPESNTWVRLIKGELGRDNRFVGSLKFSATGSEQYALRDYFTGYDELDADEQSALIDELVHGSAWVNGVVDSVKAFDGRDLEADTEIEIWFTSTPIVGSVGSKYQINFPVMRFSDGTAAGGVEAEGERLFPIDVALVNSPSVYTSRMELTLPDGWRAELPASVDIDGAFGTYVASFRQVGRRLIVSREMAGDRGVVPADRVAELTDWFSEIDADDSESLLMTHGGATVIARGEDGQNESGRLPEVLPTADELSDGATLVSEGSSDNDLMSMLSTSGVESFARTYAAEEVVFELGDSQVLFLVLGASALHNRLQAARELEYLDVVDLPVVMEAGLTESVGAGSSVGESRRVDFDVGDGAAGWIMELVTPLTTFDLGLLTMIRGRVHVSAMIMGTQGLQDADVEGLLRSVDERISDVEEYASDLEVLSDDDAEPLELSDSVGVAIEAVALRPHDFDGAELESEEFERSGDVAAFRATLQGIGPTFETGEETALSVRTEAVIYPSKEEALKAYLEMERQGLEELVDATMEDLSFGEAVAAGDESTLEFVEAPDLGALALARTAKLRRGVISDLHEVSFVEDRYVLSVILTSRADEGSHDDAVAAATLVAERFAAVIPDASDVEFEPAMVETIRNLVLVEHTIDSLVDERDFEPIFSELDGFDLESSPVTFAPGTWNRVCWYGSLYGHAERVLDACDAAVEPDPENMSRLDSRALARALSGDLDGAIEDFRTIVDQAASGAFLDTRAGWLEMLLAGENPFTEEELERLRGEP